jgi:aspartate/methionine/tyrosine aminotransferase
MVDISPLTELDDVTFVDQLIRDYGVAAVPGSSFFHRPELGRKFIRFAVCKTLEVLEEAAERLRKLKR